MKYIKKYEEYSEYNELTIDDYKFLQAGDILIAKEDVYTDKPVGSDKHWRSTRLSFFGDKIFVRKGRTKKIKSVGYNFKLSGFSPGVDIETIMKLFTIKDVELMRSMRKYNL